MKLTPSLTVWEPVIGRPVIRRGAAPGWAVMARLDGSEAATAGRST
jgi:hypothetical protein